MASYINDVADLDNDAFLVNLFNQYLFVQVLNT